MRRPTEGEVVKPETSSIESEFQLKRNDTVPRTMEDVDSMHVVQTPGVSVDSSSHDSVDSGYLSIVTPQTSGCTPKVIGGYRTRSSTGALLSAKKHRYRPEPFQCEKVQRLRSRLNHRLSVSDFDRDLSAENPIVQDSVLEPSYTLVGDQSLSLVHSTPSRANDDLGKSLENRRNWRTTVSATPVSIISESSTDLQFLSPPPSPAVPSSSYVAWEPDAEMKLVYTPSRGKSQRVTPPPKLKVLIPQITISHVQTARSSPTITSTENRKLRELRITELGATADIKPKKLDFSHRGLCASSLLRNNRRPTLDYTGKCRVDFLSLLGEESNHLNLVSKILSFLSPEDLCSASMVSSVWRRICKSDSCANNRRLSFIMRKHTIKENMWLLVKATKVKLEDDIQTSPKSRRYGRKGYLSDVQNLLNVPAQPNSPPVSPSKIRFHSFIKASRKLTHGEGLRSCPRCSFPCHVDRENNVGVCSRQGCSIEFCIFCSSKHTGPCLTPLLATPTKRHNKRLIVGSRQSKRNLRRL